MPFEVSGFGSSASAYKLAENLEVVQDTSFSPGRTSGERTITIPLYVISQDLTDNNEDRDHNMRRTASLSFQSLYQNRKQEIRGLVL